MTDIKTKRFGLDFGSDTLEIFDEEGNCYHSSFGRREPLDLYIYNNKIQIDHTNFDIKEEFYRNIKYLLALDPKIPAIKGQMTPLVAGAIMLKEIIRNVFLGGSSEKGNIKEEGNTFVFTMTLSPEEQQIFKEMFKIAFPNSKIKIINEGITQTLALNANFTKTEKFYQINLDIGGSTNFLTFSKVEREENEINNIEQKVYMIPSGGKKIDKCLSELLLDLILPIEYYFVKNKKLTNLKEKSNEFKKIWEEYYPYICNIFLKKERDDFEEYYKEKKIIQDIIKAREDFKAELEEKLGKDKEKRKWFNRKMSQYAKDFKELGFRNFNFKDINELVEIFGQGDGDWKFSFTSIYNILKCLKEHTTQHFLNELEEATEKILPIKFDDKNTDFYITCTGGTACIDGFQEEFFKNTKTIIKKFGYEEEKIQKGLDHLKRFEGQAEYAAISLDDETFEKMQITPMGHQRYIIVVNGKIVNNVDGEELNLGSNNKVDIYLPFEQIKKDGIVPVSQQTLGNSMTYERKEESTLEKIEKMIEEEKNKEDKKDGKKLEVLEKLKQDLENNVDIHENEGMLAILRAKALMGKVKAFHYKNLENIKVQNNGEEFGIFVKEKNKESKNIIKLDEDFLKKSKEEFGNFMKVIEVSGKACDLSNDIQNINMHLFNDDEENIYKQYNKILDLANKDKKILTAHQTRKFTNYCIKNSFFYQYMNCVYTFYKNNKLEKEKSIKKLQDSFNSLLESFSEFVKEEENFFSEYKGEEGVDEECFKKIMKLDEKFKQEFNNKKKK